MDEPAVREAHLLTVQEAARFLRQSERSVRRKIHRGDIPAVRLGNAAGPLRIPAAALQEWLFGDPEGAA
jgi:excisionase family DNA binding protein